MVEWLVLPATGLAPIRLDDLLIRLEESGHHASVERGDSDGYAIEINSLRVAGLVVMNGTAIEAIHLEFQEPDPSASFQAIEAIATTLGWELYPYDAEDED